MRRIGMFIPLRVDRSSGAWWGKRAKNSSIANPGSRRRRSSSSAVINSNSAAGSHFSSGKWIRYSSTAPARRPSADTPSQCAPARAGPPVAGERPSAGSPPAPAAARVQRRRSVADLLPHRPFVAIQPGRVQGDRHRLPASDPAAARRRSVPASLQPAVTARGPPPFASAEAASSDAFSHPAHRASAVADPRALISAAVYPCRLQLDDRPIIGLQPAASSPRRSRPGPPPRRSGSRSMASIQPDRGITPSRRSISPATLRHWAR